MTEQRHDHRDEGPQPDRASDEPNNKSASHNGHKNGARKSGSEDVPGLERSGVSYSSAGAIPVGEPTFGDAQPGPICGVCPLFPTCSAICEPIDALLPSMERGRVDPEDLPSLHLGVRLTNAILDHEDILTPRQREVVRLYYRQTLIQNEIATRLGITQQAVNDSLKRARLAVGRYVRKLQSEASAAPDDDILARILTEEINADAMLPGGRKLDSTGGERSSNSSQSTTHRF